MGIESGPGGYVERPRPVEGRIEGKTETGFTEVDFDDATHIPLPQSITWPTARLIFREVGRYTMPERWGMSSNIQLYAGQLEYRGANGRKRKTNLSLTTGKEKPVLFSGTRQGFYAHDPLAGGRDNPFYVVGLQPEELEENMSRMSATWHELGHVLLYDTDTDIQLLRAAITHKSRELPPVAKAPEYGAELAEALRYGYQSLQPEVDRQAMFTLKGRNHRADVAISLFHERNAWAAGMHLARANEYPTGFQKQSSYFDYAELCLASYARYFRDQRFVNGWK